MKTAKAVYLCVQLRAEIGRALAALTEVPLDGLHNALTGMAVAIVYMLTAILGLAAVLLTSSGELKALILIGAVFVVAAIGVRAIFAEHKPKPSEHSDEADAAPQDAAPSKPQEETHE